MDSLQDLFVAVMVVVGIVSTIIARFQETNPEIGFFARVFKTLDILQVFDSTRALSDVPVDFDLNDGEGFDDVISEE